MERYEYKTLYTDAKGVFGGKIDRVKYEQDLNTLGLQGWELVNTFPTAQSEGSTRWVISVFKRQID